MKRQSILAEYWSISNRSSYHRPGHVGIMNEISFTPVLTSETSRRIQSRQPTLIQFLSNTHSISVQLRPFIIYLRNRNKL